ncbi:hypothetical protein N9M66_00335 [Litoreibacter sp.]|nr:hypothetical protein [Litoreibacter sp.]
MFGYTVGTDPSDIAHNTKRLLFLGAQHIYADFPRGHVGRRKGLNRVRKVMRPNDKLVLSSLACLGTKPDRINCHIDDIEAAGIEVAVLNESYFLIDMNEPIFKNH